MTYRYTPPGRIRVVYDCGLHFHRDKAEAERCARWHDMQAYNARWLHRPPPQSDTLKRAAFAGFDGQDLRLVWRYLWAIMESSG